MWFFYSLRGRLLSTEGETLYLLCSLLFSLFNKVLVFFLITCEKGNLQGMSKHLSLSCHPLILPLSFVLEFFDEQHLFWFLFYSSSMKFRFLRYSAAPSTRVVDDFRFPLAAVFSSLLFRFDQRSQWKLVLLVSTRELKLLSIGREVVLFILIASWRFEGLLRYWWVTTIIVYAEIFYLLWLA